MIKCNDKRCIHLGVVEAVNSKNCGSWSWKMGVSHNPWKLCERFVNALWTPKYCHVGMGQNCKIVFMKSNFFLKLDPYPHDNYVISDRSPGPPVQSPELRSWLVGIDINIHIVQDIFKLPGRLRIIVSSGGTLVESPPHSQASSSERLWNP